VLDRFGDSVGRLVVGRWAAGRGALSVHVEGGGNGGLLNNAHTTGLNRADARDRRDLVVDEELVAEVNRRLAVFGRRWTGGRVDAARVRAVLDALPPSQVFGPATDIAFQIVRAGR
jgi:hypothetical protein